MTETIKIFHDDGGVPVVTDAQVDAFITGEFHFTAADGIYAGSEMGEVFVARIKPLEQMLHCVLVLADESIVAGESFVASDEADALELAKQGALSAARAKVARKLLDAKVATPEPTEGA